MGTLTAGQPRLDHFCEHKLPTSCRLTSIGECCACYDERAHAASYSTYIDGVGYVPRGTRWQRYCWFCKEFWEKRVEVSGLRPGQTRIPEIPDQSEFLARWYEFHQGFRITTKEDGTEDKVAVLGEALRDVAPGCLPRTLDELRLGREQSEAGDEERARRQQATTLSPEPAAAPGESLDQTLDQMLYAAEQEERHAGQQAGQLGTQVEPSSQGSRAHVHAGNVHAQAMMPAGARNRDYQARRIAVLRRELHRMRSGIERVILNLRDLGEDMPDHTEASTRLSELGRTLDTITGPPSREDASRAIESVNTLAQNAAMTQSDRTLASMQARVDLARQHVNESRANRDQAASELETAEQEFLSAQSRLRQLQSEQRTTENYMRLFGTREEMASQGENYESPIASMFNRAWERARANDEAQREERTLRQVLAHEAITGEGDLNTIDVAGRLGELQSRERDVWGVPRAEGLRQTTITQYTMPPQTRRYRSPEIDLDLRGDEIALEEYYSLLRRQNWNSTVAETANTAPTNEPVSTQDASAQAEPAAQIVLEPDHTQLDADAEDNRRRLYRRAAAIGDVIASATGSPDHLRGAIPPPRTTLGIVAGPPGEQLDDDPILNNDRGLDAVFALSALSENGALRAQLPQTPSASVITHLLRSAENNTLAWADRESIQSIVEDQNVVWAVRLPAERIRRRRQRGEHITFSEDVAENARARIIVVHDVEVMAEAFQMSAQVRRSCDLSAPEQLGMLYRLQAGERNDIDRGVLIRMLQDDAALTRARQVHETHSHELDTTPDPRVASLERDRREAARHGDHSRSELDAQRQATRVLALAAGQTAFRAGPAALLEQMANRDEATRAALERLRENGFVPSQPTQTMTTRRLRDAFYDFHASPSATDSEAEEDDDHRGLDAKDTGRPTEPMAEAELTVKLDCQVCYSQMADIACLPCGHLVMCKWCSDQHSPTMAHDRTRPRRAAACPVCRKQIRQKVRVFRP